MRLRRIWLVPAAALLSAAPITLAVRRAWSTVVEVAPGPLRLTVTAEGMVVAADGVADVPARITGRALKVYVREGDRVQAGQLLALIDSGEVSATAQHARAELRAAAADVHLAMGGARAQELEAADAELAGAESALALAQDREGRAAKLIAAQAVPEREHREAQYAVELAAARVSEARARRDLLRSGSRPEKIDETRARAAAAAARLSEVELSVGHARLVAPISGVVLARRVDEGDTVGMGPTLFEIADVTRTELRLEVEEPDATEVKEGLRVTVTTPGGQRVLGQGVIRRCGSRVEPRAIGPGDLRVRAESRIRPVWVDLPDGGDPMPIGMRVEGHVELPVRNVQARVPRTAVRIRDGGVTVTLASSWMRSVPVTLGLADAEYVEVAGIDAGSRVLLHP
jgi:multidrug efflux pump subunit AcrA (membrane-fusion protein)